MTDANKPKAKPIPTLLSKSDAMLYAADRLDDSAANLMRMKIFADAMNKSDKPLDTKADESLAELRVMASGIVDAEIQEKVMRAAAVEIRQMAYEAKLVEARANARGASLAPASA